MRTLRERCHGIRGAIPSIPGADRSLRESFFRLTSHTLVSCIWWLGGWGVRSGTVEEFIDSRVIVVVW